MHEMAESSGEGSPAVEQVEKQILGTENYQKAEVVHRFADENQWVHPLLIGGSVVVIVCGILLTRYFLKRRN